MITLDSMKAAKEFYTEVEKEFSKYSEEFKSNPNWEDDIKITCDEVWCILEYVEEKTAQYPIDIDYNGDVYRINYTGDYIQKMLLVNMLFCLYEMGYTITLNGEKMDDLDKKIDF